MPTLRQIRRRIRTVEGCNSGPQPEGCGIGRLRDAPGFSLGSEAVQPEGCGIGRLRDAPGFSL
ncbi:MAG: hypothetical protein ACUVV3_05070, partial [Dehalococcoidia bacterium]